MPIAGASDREGKLLAVRFEVKNWSEMSTVYPKNGDLTWMHRITTDKDTKPIKVNNQQGESMYAVPTCFYPPLSC
jgi:hypothetical protein